MGDQVKPAPFRARESGVVLWDFAMDADHHQGLLEARARLDWASRRIDEFEAAVNEFLSDCPCHESIEERVEWQEPYYVRLVTYRARPTKAPPMSLRMMAGDAIHSLRASVDNLVWRAGTVFGAKGSLGLFFRDRPDDFVVRARDTKLSRLPEEIQAWMEDQQIYKQPSGNPSPLHKLNTLWNGDKHKIAALVSSAAPAVVVHGVRGHLHRVDIWTTEDGEVVIVAEGKGDLNPSFEVQIRFPEFSQEAVAFLREMEQHIRQLVLPRFEPYFP